MTTGEFALKHDAIVVGSGPNGFAAAITLARAGLSVLLLEREQTLGGGARSAELTLPGFVHDVCSAIYPFGIASHFFRTLPMVEHGLEWIQPPAALAHPLDDGTAAMLERSIEDTGKTIAPDAEAYRRLVEPFLRDWEKISDDILAPLHWPRHALLLAQFGWRAIRPARVLAESAFEGERARALFAGLAAHSILPLESRVSAAFGIVLGILGHLVGWPIVRGGAQQLSNALARCFRSLGGEIRTGTPVSSIDELPAARLVFLDVTPRQLLRLTDHKLPAGYRRKLENFRYGPAAFKMDWALDGPIPWIAGECVRAATVHLGGTLREIAASESAVAAGEIPDKPFVLLAQQSLFDPSRAPAGKHTAWGYCHVPNGSTVDMSERIEKQIERYAPGFRDRILARCIHAPVELERYNPNYIGGDIAGGAQDWRQLFARPVARLVPYATSLKGLYICSSSTPPGAGVHGLCGHFAAQAALSIL